MFKNMLSQLVQKLMGPGPDSDSFQDEAYIVVSVQRLIDEAIPRVDRLLSKHGIALRLEIQPGDLSIECKEENFKQAFYHMLKNSCEAVASMDEKWIEVYATEGIDCVEFSIIDSSPNTRFVFTMPVYQMRKFEAA